jgi:CheY-like chemotaxis protein
MASATKPADPQGSNDIPKEPHDPAETWSLGGRLLDRAKELTRSIAGRVRATLRAAGREAPLLRVLVVDDHPDAADTLSEVLGLLGCDTRACYNGASAVELATDFCPDACLLDLAMPGMDGFEVAGRLRAGAGARPLLLVATTALSSPDDRTRTALAGFHYHLVKPVDTPTLFDALRRFGEATGRRPQPPTDAS